MEDKLVTLAIHTFEKAQILKTMLETEGIEVYIHNVNQIQPVVSAVYVCELKKAICLMPCVSSKTVNGLARMPNKRKSRSSGKEDIDTDRLFRLFYQSV